MFFMKGLLFVNTCHMVKKGEATLDCDKACDAFKASKENLTSKEEAIRKQEELKAQQVSDMLTNIKTCAVIQIAILLH